MSHFSLMVLSALAAAASAQSGLSFGNSRGRANCICPANYAPVCGRDGRTYGNTCGARCQGVSVDCPGECPCRGGGGGGQCFCTLNLQPVCGVNGRTYSNSCTARCDNVNVDCQGSCPCGSGGGGGGNNCICPANFDPVCGRDGRTYSNSCSAGCERVGVQCQGSCPCRRGVGQGIGSGGSGGSFTSNNCSRCARRRTRRVCASDNLTYENACAARCRGLRVVSRGRCPGGGFFSPQVAGPGSTTIF